MSRGVLTVAGEGITDQVVLEQVAVFAGWSVGSRYGGRGKARLMKQLPGFNAAARRSPWAVVIDLDTSAECAPAFLRCLPPPAALMRLRIAVRAIESWLLADPVHLGRFLRVSRDRIPPNPDMVSDPKQVMVEIARHSRDSAIRHDMVPRPGQGRKEGPGYAGRLQEFALIDWAIAEAAERSPSVAASVRALRSLSPT